MSEEEKEQTIREDDVRQYFDLSCLDQEDCTKKADKWEVPIYL